MKYSIRTWSAHCLAIVGLSCVLGGCGSLAKGRGDLDVGVKQRGIASWYGGQFNGQVTASGEIFNSGELTGAHRTLPMGTIIKVTNARNGLQVRVRINDRGPYANGRVLDLSQAAAEALDLVEPGIAPIQLEVTAHNELFPKVEGVQSRWTAVFEKHLAEETSERETGMREISVFPVVATEMRDDNNGPWRMTPSDIMLQRRVRRETLDPRTADLGEEDHHGWDFV